MHADEAAEIAEAAFADTVEAALRTTLRGQPVPVVVAIDGDAPAWMPERVETFAQIGATFADRLEHAWATFGRGGVQIGMDTPQVTAVHLAAAIERLERHPAVIGLAEDGGWWGLGLRRPRPGIFSGIEMSVGSTGGQQVRRLVDLDLEPSILPTLVDIDHWTDALTVADAAPHTRAAAVVRRISARTTSVGGQP